MRQSTITLADGRALTYYDEEDHAVREQVDQRKLPAPAPAPQLRHDPLLDEWVAIATHRQTRTFLPPSDECPLCPSTPRRATEIPASDYDVVVFGNRFPSFPNCDVVCFTSDHHASFAALPPGRVRLVLDALADRTASLSQLPEVAQVFCFENRGPEIGVTLHHPHGQIYGYPFVPPRTATMLDSARRHAERTGGNLFADVLAAEQTAGERVVLSNAHWTAYVPQAARWPFEVHVVPHRQVPDLPALSGAERDAFAPLYLDLLRRFDALFQAPMPYVSAWHQAPTRTDRDLAYLHLQLFSTRRASDKLKFLAGSESAMGAFVNDVLPEHAAELLRAAR